MLKHPLVLALAAGLAVLAVAFALPLWHMGRGSAAPAAAVEQGLPWQAQAQADGTLQVFGLRLGRDTLADAERRVGDGLQVAVVARLGEVGALEALAEPFSAGFVAGRLVLAFDAPADALRRWREQAPGSEPMDGGVRRFKLTAADRDAARGVRLAGLSFVPALRLSETDLRQRFGAPAAELAQPGGAKVLLYPALGLAASVAADGQAGSRGVLQYVAPRDFEARLRQPLLAALAGAAASAPAAAIPPAVPADAAASATPPAR